MRPKRVRCMAHFLSVVLPSGILLFGSSLTVSPLIVEICTGGKSRNTNRTLSFYQVYYVWRVPSAALGSQKKKGKRVTKGSGKAFNQCQLSDNIYKCHPPLCHIVYPLRVQIQEDD